MTGPGTSEVPTITKSDFKAQSKAIVESHDIDKALEARKALGGRTVNIVDEATGQTEQVPITSLAKA